MIETPDKIARHGHGQLAANTAFYLDLFIGELTTPSSQPHPQKIFKKELKHSLSETRRTRLQMLPYPAVRSNAPSQPISNIAPPVCRGQVQWDMVGTRGGGGKQERRPSRSERRIPKRRQRRLLIQFLPPFRFGRDTLSECVSTFTLFTAVANTSPISYSQPPPPSPP